MNIVLYTLNALATTRILIRKSRKSDKYKERLQSNDNSKENATIKYIQAIQREDIGRNNLFRQRPSENGKPSEKRE